LENPYTVLSSFGHIRDLPKSKLGIDVANNFEPTYTIPKKAEPVLEQLKDASAKAAEVILATDEDREGEAIAWHLTHALGLDQKKTKRIVFHEITKSAIAEALEHPRAINLRLVDAQQARRILDRLVGYELSPFLWRKIAYGLSAGRVQSAALRLIAEREAEIGQFAPQEFWTVTGTFETKKEEMFGAALVARDEKTLDKFALKTKDDTAAIVSDLAKATWNVTNVETKPLTKHPTAPFTTSTLQQQAWSKLHYSAKQTMMFAQRLYEQGLITYMRTDSTNLSGQSVHAARDYIAKTFGDAYLPKQPNVYRAKSRLAQEAHEAIRPTDAQKTPESLKGTLESQPRRVYELIWKRFLACQMAPATLTQTAITVRGAAETHAYNFRATGQTVVFEGFLALWPLVNRDANLPKVAGGDTLRCQELVPEQHFTDPPARYNDASIVKTLEALGIGRPSTYASIIGTILARNYIERNDSRALQLTYLGKVVNDLLVKHFTDVVD
jgi:DNA topoisomerase-1